MSVDPASAPTSTGMSYLCPRPSTTFSNRNALRWLSGNPRNCSRTSGCSSVSLLIGVVTRTSLPARSRPSTYLPSVGQYEAIKPSQVAGARRRRRANKLLVLSSFVRDGLHFGDDRGPSRDNPGDDFRHLAARLRVEVEIEAKNLVTESGVLHHFRKAA